MKEFKIRSELGRVDRMRRRFGSGIDAETARDLNESEQILLADLSAVLSPEPLED
jgi:hypothetical protein